MPRDASLTQNAYERLRADLLAWRLRPGERLKIADLCASFSVSLGAVREALSRLTSDGLVVAEPRGGYRAAPISAADLADLTEVRVEVEAMCLRRAIAVGDVAWESGIVAASHRLARTPRRHPDDPDRLSDQFSDAHFAFHEALVAACDRPWLLWMRNLLFVQSERYRRLSLPREASKRDVEKEHHAIMEAVLARDAERAVTEMTGHLETTTRILLTALGTEEAVPEACAKRQRPSRSKAQ